MGRAAGAASGPGCEALLAVKNAGAEVGQHGVGFVDLVADSAKIWADPAKIAAPGDGVLQESAGLGAIGVVR